MTDWMCRKHNQTDYREIALSPFQLIAQYVALLVFTALITMWVLMNTLLVYNIYTASSLAEAGVSTFSFTIWFFYLGSVINQIYNGEI